MENCDNEKFAEQKQTLVAAFDHMEGILQSSFTDSNAYQPIRPECDRGSILKSSRKQAPSSVRKGGTERKGRPDQDI